MLKVKCFSAWKDTVEGLVNEWIESKYDSINNLETIKIEKILQSVSENYALISIFYYDVSVI